MSKDGKQENKIRHQSKLFESQEEHCDESPSGPSSITYSGDNEEEYLRATFSRLGVGLDGFLSLEELTKVCHAIGMDKVASEVIDQLFSRLDVDGDGRISFEEFLLMFQNGGPETGTNQATVTLDDSLSQESSLMTNASCMPSVGNTGSFVTEFGLFSSLDPEGSGYVGVRRLLEAWFSVGLSDGERVLRELGLPHGRGDKVRVADLGAVMEEEFRPQHESTSSSSSSASLPPSSALPKHIALLTLLHEIKWLRSNLESARGERDKYRWDLGEANHRIALFAQELDDQNAVMERNSHNKINELERSYKEQVRELQEALSRERDNGRETALSDSRELIALNSRLQEEETRLKGRVAALEGDLKKLEVENLELSVKLNEAQNLLQNLEKQSQELNQLREKVEEYESRSPREEEFRKLATKVEELIGENQRLRDNNDELIAQVDSYSSRITMGKREDYSLDGSCIGDYLDNSSNEGTLGGLKRRGGTSPSRKSSPEDGNTDDDESSPRGSKIRKKSSNQIHFHYLDVTSHDESFLDGSFTDPQHTPQHFHSSSSPGRNLKQPSSLPPYLHSVSPGIESLSAERMKELENEIKILKREKEEMACQVLRANQILQKHDIEGGLKNECEINVSESASKHSSSSSSSSLKRFRHKCSQCFELESRLNVALEELEMALKREKQNLTLKSEDHDVAMNRMQELIDHCQELEQELSEMKIKVLRLIEEKNQLESEREKWNCGSASWSEGAMKSVRNQLEEFLVKLKKKRSRCFVSSSLGDMSSGPPSHGGGGGREIIPTIIEEEEEEEELDGRQKVNEERGLEGLEKMVEMELEKAEREFNGLEERWSRERDLLEKQKALAEDRFAKAEEDYQVLKSEYEKIEDYWHMKFQDEVDYYEEERKLYDEKFSALETKIKEYEEMALNTSSVPVEVPGPGSESNAEGFSDDSEDRLSTIDESAVWERQVTDLEDEVKCLQNKLREINEERENMEMTWNKRLASEQKNYLQELNRLKAELEHTKAMCRTLENQLCSAREELDRTKKFGAESVVSTSSSFQGHVNGERELLNDSHQDCVKGEGEAVAFDSACGLLETRDQASWGGEAAAHGALKLQLSKYQKRIKQLEHLLKVSQKCSSDIINQTNERHKAEVQSLQNMMNSTQQVFTSNFVKYKDQLSKAVRGDLLVRELYMENAQLMLALQVTEERQKEAEEQLRKLQIAHQMAAVSHLQTQNQ